MDVIPRGALCTEFVVCTRQFSSLEILARATLGRFASKSPQAEGPSSGLRI